MARFDLSIRLRWRSDEPRAPAAAPATRAAGIACASSCAPPSVPKEDAARARKHADSGWRLRQLKGDCRAAIEEYTLATRLDPRCAGHFFGLGFSLEEAREYGKALAAYAEAIRRKPDVSHYTCRTRTYVKMGNYQSAIADMKTAINMEPNFDHLHKDLGAIYMTTKDYKAAFNSYGKAVSLDSRNKYYKEKLAEAKSFEKKANNQSSQ